MASVFYGLRTERVVVFAYALSGLMCGLAGLLYAARVGTVTVVLASGLGIVLARRGRDRRRERCRGIG